MCSSACPCKSTPVLDFGEEILNKKSRTKTNAKGLIKMVIGSNSTKLFSSAKACFETWDTYRVVEFKKVSDQIYENKLLSKPFYN
jgi:hypothetical protein